MSERRDESVAGDVAPTASHAADSGSWYSAFEGATEDFGIGAGDRDHLIGADLGGITIVRLIGQGGMGRVYEAHQVKPSRPVAVKVIRPGIVSDSHIRRFDHEAEILARLRHPGIAQIYTVGTCHLPTGEVPFFVMEYIPEARTLVDYADHKRLSAHDRLDLFRRVCDAVAHGHARGVVHRDLKPSNILIDAAGQPKVIDFGVAKSTDVDLALTTMQTDVGQLIGTLQYMSPEQFDGRPDEVDVRSDVYALGVVLYELLSGQPPYDIRRKAVVEAARVVKEEDPAPLSTLNQSLPRDVGIIAGKCLTKEPDGRYSSAAELGADVGRYLIGEPIHASPPGFTDSILRLARQHKAAAAAVSLVALSLVAAVIGISLFAAKAEQQRRDAVRSAEVARQKRTEADLNRFHWLRERGESPEAFALLDDIESRFEPGTLPIEVHVTRSEAEDSIAVFPGHAFAFSPDGAVLAISGVREHHPPDRPRYYAYLIDSVTGERLARLEAPTGGNLIGKPHFCADGSTVAIAATEDHGDYEGVMGLESVEVLPDRELVTDIFWWNTHSGAHVRSFSIFRPHASRPDDTYLPLPAVDPSTGRVLLFQQDARMTIDTGTAVTTLVPWESWSKRLARSRAGDLVAWLSPAGFVRAVGNLDDADSFSVSEAIDRAAYSGEDNGGEAEALPVMRRLLAISDDGASACCESTDGKLMVVTIDGPRPNLRAVVEPHGQDVVIAAAFGISGRVLVTLAYDGTARGLNASSGELLWTSETGCRGCPLPAVSCDGLYFAVHDKTAVAILSLEDGRVHKTLRQPGSSPSSVVFGRTGPTIAVGDTDGRVTIHSVLGNESTHWPDAQNAAVAAMAFSPDGSMLVSLTSDGCVRGRQLGAGRTLHLGKVGGSSALSSIAFDPSGTKVVLAFEDFVEVIDVLDKNNAQTYWNKYGGGLRESWFTPSGDKVVAAGQGGEIYIWPIGSPSEQESLVDIASWWKEGFGVTGSADEAITRAAVLHGSVLQLWAIDEQQLIGFLETPATDDSPEFVFSPDGTRLIGHWEGPGAVSYGNTDPLSHQRCDENAFRKRWSLPPDWAEATRKSESDTWSIFVIWDARTGRELTTFHILGGSFTPVFSPDSSSFAVSGQARSSRTGQLLATWSSAGDVAYSPDSKFLVIPGSVQRPRNGKRTKPLAASEAREELSFISFRRPNLRHQPGLGGNPFEEVAPVPGSGSVRLTPDGSRIIFREEDHLFVAVKEDDDQAKDDFSVQVTLRGRGEIGDLVCSSDGSRVAASVGNGHVALWDVGKLSSGKPKLLPEASMVREVGGSFVDTASPSGKYAVLRSPLKIVEPATGQAWPVAGLGPVVEGTDGAFMHRRGNANLSWAWSPDERFIAFAYNHRAVEGSVQGVLIICEAVEGQWVGPIVRRVFSGDIGFQFPCSCRFAFAERGPRVFFIEGEYQQVFPSVQAFTKAGTSSARRSSVSYAAISSDLSRAVSRQGDSFTVWDVDKASPVGRFTYEMPRRDDYPLASMRCVFDNAGSQAVIWFSNVSNLPIHWSSSRPHEGVAFPVEGQVRTVAFSPKADRFVVVSERPPLSQAGPRVTIFHSGDREALGSWLGSNQLEHAAFVNEGRRILTWGDSDSPKLWGLSAREMCLLGHLTQADAKSRKPLIEAWLAREGEQGVAAMRSGTEAMSTEERRVTRGAFLAKSAVIEQSKQRQAFEALRTRLQLIVQDIHEEAAKEVQQRDLGSKEEYVQGLAAESRKRLAALCGTMPQFNYVLACRLAEELTADRCYGEDEDTTAIETLSVKQARAILRQTHVGGLHLPALVDLPPNIAAVLAKYSGSVSLDGLASVSEEAARELAQHEGELLLNGLTTISSKAAEALAAHRGFLSLNGLTHLSDDVAAALAKHRGGLAVNGISVISDEAAKALARCEGNLFLDGLTTISYPVAKVLAVHEGLLSLSGLTHLSNADAAAMGQHRGGLAVNGISVISDEAAKALAQCEGNLFLNGLTTISYPVAKALAVHEGLLSLNGLAELSENIAVTLARHRGELSLNGISTISDEAAKALARHERGTLRLEGLTMLTEEAFKALRGNQKRFSGKDRWNRILLPNCSKLFFLPQPDSPPGD